MARADLLVPTIHIVCHAVAFTKDQLQYLKHFIQGVCEISPLAEAEIYLHSQRPQAIHAVEQMLNHHSTNVLAYKLLAQTTLNPNMPALLCWLHWNSGNSGPDQELQDPYDVLHSAGDGIWSPT